MWQHQAMPGTEPASMGEGGGSDRDMEVDVVEDQSR
jgi:hypothetical protein